MATTICSGIIAAESIAKEKYVMKRSTRRMLNIYKSRDQVGGGRK